MVPTSYASCKIWKPVSDFSLHSCNLLSQRFRYAENLYISFNKKKKKKPQAKGKLEPYTALKDLYLLSWNLQKEYVLNVRFWDYLPGVGLWTGTQDTYFYVGSMPATTNHAKPLSSSSGTEMLY